MKIIMLSDYFYPHMGGVETTITEISKRLVKMGHEVAVITLDTDRALEYEVVNGVEVHRTGVVELTKIIGVQSCLSYDFFGKAKKICMEMNPDVIHAHNIFFFTSLMAVFLKRSVRKPLVTTMHLGPLDNLKGLSGFLAQIYEKSIGRWMLRNNDGVIAVSNAVKEHGVRLGVPPQKLTMVPNGVDLDKFKPKTGRKKEGGKIKIAYIGRLVYNKGPDYLVKAAPKVLEECPSAGFIIIGDGPMRSVLERKVENLGIDHAFKFLGIISGVEKVLPQCDILVRPSLLEGMPLTVLEAMACAIPVVASRVAGTVELIKDGETGLLIDPGDAAQLSKALTTLIKDEGKRLALGKNARRYVERHFSWDKAAVQTLETYKKIVEEHEGIVA